MAAKSQKVSSDLAWTTNQPTEPGLYLMNGGKATFAITLEDWNLKNSNPYWGKDDWYWFGPIPPVPQIGRTP